MPGNRRSQCVTRRHIWVKSSFPESGWIRRADKHSEGLQRLRSSLCASCSSREALIWRSSSQAVARRKKFKDDSKKRIPLWDDSEDSSALGRKDEDDAEAKDDLKQRDELEEPDIVATSLSPKGSAAPSP